MTLGSVVRGLASLPMSVTRAALGPLRSGGPGVAAAPELAFKCPVCGYEVHTPPPAARYACPRCAAKLGPRRDRRYRTRPAPGEVRRRGRAR